MLEYSSEKPKANREFWARIAEGFPEPYCNLFRPQFRCPKLKERIQITFIVTLQFSCNELIQQLNNRSTQIILFSEFLDIFVGANGSQKSSAGSVVSLSLIGSNIDLKKSFLPKLLYSVTVYCFRIFSVCAPPPA